MAAGHKTALYGVRDAKVYSLLTDTGASPTYDDGVDVPGINAVGLDPNLITAELKGDDAVIAKKGRIDRLNFNSTYRRLDLDVLAVILGSAVADYADRAEYPFTTSGLVNFGLAFKIEDVETELNVADVHCLLWKCQVTGGSLFPGQVDQFATPTLQIEAIVPNASEWSDRNEPGRIRMWNAVTDLPTNIGTG